MDRPEFFTGVDGPVGTGRREPRRRRLPRLDGSGGLGFLRVTCFEPGARRPASATSRAVASAASIANAGSTLTYVSAVRTIEECPSWLDFANELAQWLPDNSFGGRVVDASLALIHAWQTEPDAVS